MTHELLQYVDQVAETLRTLPQEELKAIADALWETYLRDGTIIVCGNGGSAATASHFACDLAKSTVRAGVRRVRALSLTESVPLMTAWSNDQGYADVFLEQLTTHYRSGDLVLAISGSGNSPNVLRAVAWANEIGAPTVGLCGFDGGQLAQIARSVLRVNNYSMPQVEDAHSTICHALAVNLGRTIDDARLETNAAQGSVAGLLLERIIGR
ncbi:MAG: SIS domain-containing protein [Chloroflexales bacterium]|nr:SIS domain-containing protein [Chloroflexales bacterium]